MAELRVVTGLVAKRRELSGRIEHAQAELRQLIIDLNNLDATLRLFVPDIDLEEIKPKPPPPRHAAFKGEVARIVLGTLRDAGRAMTTQELTLQVMADRGLNTADKRLVRLIGKRVGSCLGHHRTKGLIESGDERRGARTHALWEIAR